MMRLMMEAVMVLAIVLGMVFVSKINASEKNSGTTPRDENDIDGDNG